MELADPVKRTLGNYERHNPGTRRTSSSPRPRRSTLGRRGQDLDGVFLPKCAIRDGGGSIIGRNTKAMTDSGCHCERSEAIPKGTVLPDRDRFVAPLLAMT